MFSHVIDGLLAREFERHDRRWNGIECCDARDEHVVAAIRTVRGDYALVRHHLSSARRAGIHLEIALDGHMSCDGGV